VWSERRWAACEFSMRPATAGIDSRQRRPLCGPDQLMSGRPQPSRKKHAIPIAMIQSGLRIPCRVAAASSLAAARVCHRQ
jgi:hypothetical protein